VALDARMLDIAEATFGYLFTSDNKRESFLITWPLRVRRERLRVRREEEREGVHYCSRVLFSSS